MRTLIIILLLIISGVLNAQEDFKKPNMSSPNASKLFEFGSIPVSNYTGIPNISIPIFNLVEGDINVPISIDYHASGIKVEEVASSVGLGWALNCGGLIGDEVRGKSDIADGFEGSVIKEIVEHGIINYCIMTNQTNRNSLNYYGMYSTTSWAEDFLDESVIRQNDLPYLLEIRDNGQDGEADLFYCSTPEISCKFFKNNDGDFMTFPHQNILISWDNIQGKWLIIGPNGVKYTYSKSEWCQPEDNSIGYITTWWISEIEDINGNKVLFNYEPYMSHSYSTMQSGYELIEANGDFARPSYSKTIAHTHTLHSSQILKSITTSSGNIISFFSSTNRLDQEYEYIIDSIHIINCQNEIVNRVRLFHSYFNGLQSIRFPFEDQTFPNSDNSKRLRLDSISLNQQTYRFNYDLTELPNRYSIDQDLWGYYNAAGNTSFVPYYFEGNNENYISIDGGDRTVNPSVNQAGVLKEIEYPTGGKTLFNYETNKIRDTLHNCIPALVKLNSIEKVYYCAAPNCSSSQGYYFTPAFEIDYGSTPLFFEFNNILNDPPNWAEYTYIDIVDNETSGINYSQTLLDQYGLTFLPDGLLLPPGMYKLKMCTGLSTF